MKRASVRDLRYAFPKVEAALADGEEIEIVKRNKVLAHLIPVPKPRPVLPDFLARMRRIHGDTVLETSNTDLLAADRKDRF